MAPRTADRRRRRRGRSKNDVSSSSRRAPPRALRHAPPRALGHAGRAHHHRARRLQCRCSLSMAHCAAPPLPRLRCAARVPRPALRRRAYIAPRCSASASAFASASASPRRRPCGATPLRARVGGVLLAVSSVRFFVARGLSARARAVRRLSPSAARLARARSPLAPLVQALPPDPRVVLSALASPSRPVAVAKPGGQRPPPPFGGSAARDVSALRRAHAVGACATAPALLLTPPAAPRALFTNSDAAPTLLHPSPRHRVLHAVACADV